MTTHRPKEKRIATSGFALLAMTEVDESQSRRFPPRRMSKTARRLTKAVIPRPVLKLVVGIRIPFRRTMTTHRPKEKRIATSGFALLAMTEVDESQSRRFPPRRMSKTARRLTKAVIPRPVLKLVVGIRVPLHRT